MTNLIFKNFDRSISYIFILFFFGFFAYSCYYDNEEYLYPQTSQCDTSVVTYSATIQPVLSNYCVGCHSGQAPSGNISLETYSNIKTQADNGQLVNSVFGTNGAVMMPYGGELTNCEKIVIKKWVSSGAPNN